MEKISAELLQGVDTINLPKGSTPARICVFGRKATPLVVPNDAKTYFYNIAGGAGLCGPGKVLAFGDLYFPNFLNFCLTHKAEPVEPRRAGLLKFLQNAVKWMLQADNFGAVNAQKDVLYTNDLGSVDAGSLGGKRLIICEVSKDTLESTKGSKAVFDFVQNGGNLVVGAVTTGLNDAKISISAVNQIVKKAGMVYALPNEPINTDEFPVKDNPYIVQAHVSNLMKRIAKDPGAAPSDDTWALANIMEKNLPLEAAQELIAPEIEDLFEKLQNWFKTNKVDFKNLDKNPKAKVLGDIMEQARIAVQKFGSQRQMVGDQIRAELTAGLDFVSLKDGCQIGRMVVFGDSATPLLVSNKAEDFMHRVAGAAGMSGKGKVAAFAHDNFTIHLMEFFEGKDSMPPGLLQFFKNLMRWMIQVDSSDKIMESWVHYANKDIRGLKAGDLEGKKLLVYNGMNGHCAEMGGVEVVREYVKNGGNLVMAATMWGWPEPEPLRSSSFNKILADAGMFYFIGDSHMNLTRFEFGDKKNPYVAKAHLLKLIQRIGADPPKAPKADLWTLYKAVTGVTKETVVGSSLKSDLEGLKAKLAGFETEDLKELAVEIDKILS